MTDARMCQTHAMTDACVCQAHAMTDACVCQAHAMPANNALEVAENLVRRSAQTQLTADGGLLRLDKLEIVDVLFNLTVCAAEYRVKRHPVSLPCHPVSSAGATLYS